MAGRGSRADQQEPLQAAGGQAKRLRTYRYVAEFFYLKNDWHLDRGNLQLHTSKCCITWGNDLNWSKLVVAVNAGWGGSAVPEPGRLPRCGCWDPLGHREFQQLGSGGWRGRPPRAQVVSYFSWGAPTTCTLAVGTDMKQK